MEKFLKVLDENRESPYHNGVLLNLDELTDFFPNLNRYNGANGNPLAKFLLLYNCEDITIDRLTREDQLITEPICTIIGGIQPERYKMVFGGEYGSGFVPRWLFMHETPPEKFLEKNQIYHKFWEDIFTLAIEMPDVDLNFSGVAEKELRSNTEKRKEQNYLLRSRAQHLGEYIVKQNYTVRRLAGIIHVTNALTARKPVTPEISYEEFLFAENLVDFFIKSFVIFEWQMEGKFPLSAPQLTKEEIITQLFEKYPELNVTALAGALQSDKSNLFRIKRSWRKSMQTKDDLQVLSDDFSVLYPNVMKAAGGEISEDTLEMLLATCNNDTDRLNEVLAKLEASPKLKQYTPDTLWRDGWVECLATF